MKRVNKMKEGLQDELQQHLNKWQNKLSEYEIPQIKEAFEWVKANLEEEVCLVITYLRSSAITGKHIFKIALYKKTPFNHEAIWHRFINLSSLYQPDSDLDEQLIKTIKNKFIRTATYELEEIRRYYVISLYQQSQFLFKPYLAKTGENQDSIPVYYGEELGETQVIGVMK